MPQKISALHSRIAPLCAPAFGHSTPLRGYNDRTFDFKVEAVQLGEGLRAYPRSGYRKILGRWD